MTMRLRPVEDGDAVMLYRWHTDPETRRFTPYPEPDEWDNHLAWFIKRIPLGRFYVGEHDPEGAVGVVRVDHRDHRDWISITIDPRSRGRGYATGLLEAVVREVETLPLWAMIHEGNLASVKVFKRAGFVYHLDSTPPWHVYQRDR